MGRFNIEKLAERLSAKRGGTPCPACGEKQILDFKDSVATCQACGYRASRSEWSFKSMRASQEDAPHLTDPNSPPPNTRIIRKEIAPGTIAWEIPPSGKSNGMLFFAIFWLVVIAIPTVGIFFGENESEDPVWIPLAFFGLFWAIGLGMLYAGLRAKYAYHLLMIDQQTAVLARSLFNQKSTTSLKRTTLKSAQKKEFYQKNYTPVYGIEVRGEEGKFRFGTTLSEDEKNWLVADLKRVLWPEKSQAFRSTSNNTDPTRSELPVSTLPRELKPFTITFPPARAKGSIIGIAMFLVIVTAFLGIGIFAMKDAGFFRWVWLGLNSLFALAGISGAIKTIKDRKKIVEVRGDRTGVHVETLRDRVPIKEESMPYSPAVQVRSFNTGRNGNSEMVRIELVGENKVITIHKWYPQDAADEPLKQLQEALR